MSKKTSNLIDQAIFRNLSDGLYEKRKLGALEIQQTIRDYNKAESGDKIIKILVHLREKFIESSSANSRKGGLMALATSALALEEDVNKYLAHLIPPILRCLVDADNKVRYYACESLYNIAKVTGAGVFCFFNEIFDNLCKLAADPDSSVRDAADLLDNLIKDLVIADSTILDMDYFIPLLSKRIHVTNQACRKFLISWIIILDSVPGIELVKYLPQFLNNLFKILNDPAEEVGTNAFSCLSELLQELKQSPLKVNIGDIVDILCPYCDLSDQNGILSTQLAFVWFSEIIAAHQEAVLPFASRILHCVLTCISHSSDKVREITQSINEFLFLMVETRDDVNVKSILDVVMRLLTSKQQVPTLIASLKWMQLLQTRAMPELMNQFQELFSVLLNMISDPTEDIVKLSLQVLAKLSTNNAHFDRLINCLVDLFRSDPELLHLRGNFIIKQMSHNIPPEKIYRTLSKVLETDSDLEFASNVVQKLNLNLLTGAELHGVRASLKSLSPEGECLFSCLYKSWSHNPICLFSLCLLAQVYKHAFDLILNFSSLEITVDFLVEIDKLIQLLESPVFMYLRLQLLEPDKYPYLFKALFGLLMLLPQSNTFNTLKNRLMLATSLNTIVPKSDDISSKSTGNIDFDGLLAHFYQVQAKHSIQLRQRRILSKQNQDAQQVAGNEFPIKQRDVPYTTSL
ncbi:protein VAC14 homolog [Schistocerca gregaria]|uniref:protein VAC14 homolog n=1 Tax=Schistocerca gregaria TaxID=7010 RepID=UPI00211EA50E|nr:protein VAC14 homolog [Schistocerca gregaria]